MVTGSTDGIGKAYAKELGHRGLNLVLISRSREKLEKTRDEIWESAPKIKITIIAADFSKGKEVYPRIKEELDNIPVGILGTPRIPLCRACPINDKGSLVVL